MAKTTQSTTSLKRSLCVEANHPAGVKLRLKGKWLQKAGFFKGDVVTVTVRRPGLLEIQAMESPGIAREDNQLKLLT